MDLNTYIANVGDEAAAKRFGVSRRTTEAWRLGARSPSRKKAAEIIELTRDDDEPITLDGIYSPARQPIRLNGKSAPQDQGATT